MTDNQTTGQEWARIIQNGATAPQVHEVISAINKLTGARRTNGASVMVACAQILGQSISDAGPEIAAEMRLGLMAMVDGFAMQTATLEG
jgi:hypothetical protein